MPTEYLLRELVRRLHALLADPTLMDRDGVLSIYLAVPLQPYLPAIDDCNDCLYWSQPSQQHERRGSGRIPLAVTAGSGRFRELEQALQTLQGHWQVLDPDATGSCNAVFCGFAFDADDICNSRSAGLDNTLLFIPEVLLEQRAGNSRLVLSCRTGVDADTMTVIDNWMYRIRCLLTPAASDRLAGRDNDRLRPTPVPDDRHQWIQRVRQALAAIDSGQLSKVVLSRQLCIELPIGFRLRDTLAWLIPRYPRCTLFAIRHGGQTLIGVSPENLLSLERKTLHIDALGGTAGRSGDPQKDLQLADALLHSDKTLHEHRLVVEDITRRLRPYCNSLLYPQQPSILKLPDIQHLQTRISGKTSSRTSVLQLAAQLHPTPATGGLPRTAALQWMRQHGEQSRGWYTGALGWMNATGDGELAVILRCASVGQHQATLYAGAGIVSGSDPQQEYLETEWKLQTMIAALQAGGNQEQPLSPVKSGTGRLP